MGSQQPQSQLPIFSPHSRGGVIVFPLLSLPAKLTNSPNTKHRPPQHQTQTLLCHNSTEKICCPDKVTLGQGMEKYALCFSRKLLSFEGTSFNHRACSQVFLQGTNPHQCCVRETRFPSQPAWWTRLEAKYLQTDQTNQCSNSFPRDSSNLEHDENVRPQNLLCHHSQPEKNNKGTKVRHVSP